MALYCEGTIVVKFTETHHCFAWHHQGSRRPTQVSEVLEHASGSLLLLFRLSFSFSLFGV
jgi:hypothetical protein